MTRPEDREDYAHFYKRLGHALCICQGFELSLKTFLSYGSAAGIITIGSTKFEDFLDKIEKKTTGQLLKDAKAHIKFSEEEEGTLQKAVTARNRLVHHIAVENTRYLYDHSVRNELVREIENLVEIVIKGEEVLRPANLHLIKISEELLKEVRLK